MVTLLADQDSLLCILHMSLYLADCHGGLKQAETCNGGGLGATHTLSVLV